MVSMMPGTQCYRHKLFSTGRHRSSSNIKAEYLIKQYLQTSGQEPVYRQMWDEALAGIQKHLIVPTRHSRLKIVGELPRGIGGPLSPKMDHLVCFLPGEDLARLLLHSAKCSFISQENPLCCCMQCS